MHPAVHGGANIGLGDDQGHWLGEKVPDLIGHGHPLATALQNRALRIAQQAQARFRVSHMIPILIGEGAHAEEGEVIVREPLEKLHRFSDLIHRNRRWVAAEILNQLVHALNHGAPIHHREAHIIKGRVQGLLNLFQLGLVFNALNVNLDNTFAHPFPLAIAKKGRALAAARVALDRENRVHHKANFQRQGLQRGHGGVHQKRHVVVIYSNDGDAGECLALVHLVRGDIEARLAVFSCFSLLPCGFCQHGQLIRAIRLQILGGSVSEKAFSKVFRHAFAVFAF